MSSLLQTGKARLAHSKLTAHAVGPNDLRPLADLISSEKGVLGSTNKTSQDVKKAADALRDWGSSQGDDLADILPKVAFLFEQLAKAQSTYAEHASTYRLHFKSLRTREENLISLRKSKDSLASRIDSAEKQLNKTSAEHKDRANREQKLYDLRQEMISSENEVVNEEARLSDFKRDTTREAMGLKLGAMLELSERQTIIAEMARLLVAEVPTARTIPGQGRAQYNGYAATEEVMQEAQQCLTSVIFNPVASNTANEQRTPTRADYDTSVDSAAPQIEDSSKLYPPPQNPPQNTETQENWAGVSRRYSGNALNTNMPTNNPIGLSSSAHTSRSDTRSSLAYMEQTPESTPAPHTRRPLSYDNGPTYGSGPLYSAEPESAPPAILLPDRDQQSLAIPDLPQMPVVMQEQDTETERGHGDATTPTLPTPPAIPAPVQRPEPVLQPEAQAKPARSSLPAPPQILPQSISAPQIQPPASQVPVSHNLSQSQSQVPTKQREPAPAYTYAAAQDAKDRLSQSLPSAPPRITALDLMDPPYFRRTDSSNSPTTPTGGRPRGPSRGDSNRTEAVLGSRHGFDDPAYRAEKDANNLSQTAQFPNRPPIKDTTGAPAGYSYQPVAKMPAGANRKLTSSSNYTYSVNGSSPYPTSAGAPPGPSPAAQIREAYLQQQQVDAVKARSDSRDESQPPVAPLKFAKRDGNGSNGNPGSPRLPTSPSMAQTVNVPPDQTTGGFSGNRYVTRLD